MSASELKENGRGTGEEVDDDAWAVFGSDSDDGDDAENYEVTSSSQMAGHDNDNEGHTHGRYGFGSASAESISISAADEEAADASSLHLTTSFLRQCPSLRLSDRYVTVHHRVTVVRRPRRRRSESGPRGEEDGTESDDGGAPPPPPPPPPASAEASSAPPVPLAQRCRSALVAGLKGRGMRVAEWPPSAPSPPSSPPKKRDGEVERDEEVSLPPPPTADAVAVFEVLTDGYDRYAGEDGDEVENDEQKASWRSCAALPRSVVPGGWLLVFTARHHRRCGGSAADEAPRRLLGLSPRIWAVEDAVDLLGDRSDHAGRPRPSVWAVKKREGLINTLACPWKDDDDGGGGAVSGGTGKNEDEPSWKSDPSGAYELRLASETAVGRTAHERSFPPYHIDSLCDDSVKRAVDSLRRHGFVVLRDLVPTKDVLEWGEATLRDLDEAVRRLEVDRGIKLLEPGRSADPLSYRELAMREDLRVDIRDGPAIRALRRREREDRRHVGSPKEDDVGSGERGGDVYDVDAHEGSDVVEDAASLRRHPAVLAVVGRALNPPGPHHRGNYGRWNFGGSGPDGSPMPVKVGRIGAVVSFPGCGDQALHADTPHLFEHDDLPPHYVNLFYPALEQLPSSLRGGEEGGGDGGGGGEDEDEDDGGCPEFDGDTDVGGTAFVAGSHLLGVCERLTTGEDGDGGGEGRSERLARIVRPSLDAGDALLFDCRVLHFGLANRSSSTSKSSSSSSSSSFTSCGMDLGGGGGVRGSRGRRRPLLYVNLTHEWFNDPKNWDDREKLFPELD